MGDRLDFMSLDTGSLKACGFDCLVVRTWVCLKILASDELLIPIPTRFGELIASNSLNFCVLGID